MTADRLGEIRARLASATTGPWTDDGWDIYHDRQEWQRCVMSGDGRKIIADCPSELFGSAENIPTDNPARLNAAFIASAPSDVAYLLGVAERAQALLDEIQHSYGGIEPCTRLLGCEPLYGALVALDAAIRGEGG